MSCDFYIAHTFDEATQTDGECFVGFTDTDDTVGCLCTFPHNYQGKPLSASTVQSLALLGAAIVLARREPISREYFMIPADVPQWIRDSIKAICGLEHQ